MCTAPAAERGRELELPSPCGKFNKAKQGAAGGRMNAELRETWYNMCADGWVQENRWSGENFSDLCLFRCCPSVVPSSEKSKKGAWRAWAHSSAAKHPLPLLRERNVSTCDFFLHRKGDGCSIVPVAASLERAQKGHRISLPFSS